MNKALPSPLSLRNAEAAQWNRDLMLKFEAELERNPEADLLSMFPDSYHSQHQKSQYRELSTAGKFNLRTLHNLYEDLKDEPELNILSSIPKSYSRRIKLAVGPKTQPPDEEESEEKRADFRTRLDIAESATVVFPLSEKVTALLELDSSGSCKEERSNGGNLLAESLKQLLWGSPKLWESYFRGVVLKCSDDVVAKVVRGSRDYTEYRSMQFLAERAPDIPVPRGHGMIALEPFHVTFMSFIPGTTLAEAWPSLSREGKLSIQRQLEDMFCRLRSLRQEDGKVLGGVCGEGVKEPRVDECALFKDITTAKEFSELQFSARHYGSKTYVKLLRSFLEHDSSESVCGSVFTHGDIRTANIMVEKPTSSDGQYCITGIIDWEDSGFYPAHHECTTLTRNLGLKDEDEWYSYLPESISPTRFPIRWLVDRLWDLHLKS